MSNLIFIKDNDNNVGIGSNMINDIKGNINITQNLNVTGNLNINSPAYVGVASTNNAVRIIGSGYGNGAIGISWYENQTSAGIGTTSRKAYIYAGTDNSRPKTQATHGNLYLYSSNDIRLNADRYVAINTPDAPDYPLHVGPSNRLSTTSSIKAWAYYDVSSVFHFGEGNAANFQQVGRTDFHISAKFDNNIWVDGNYIILSSDSRIKTNIVDVPDNLALQQLRTIPCRYYEYIDKLSLGSNKTIGFIAQEVKSVIPMAVTQQKKIIPNVYKVINCTWTSNNDKFIMSSIDFSNVNDFKYKFYVSNNSDYSDEKEIILTGNSDNTFTFDTQYTNVFCYGSEVEDFHTLDKNKLFTVNFSATQEIDRIQQTHITEIASLKAENQQQQTEIASLKTENATLKSVIDKLKTANSFEEFKQTL